MRRHGPLRRPRSGAVDCDRPDEQLSRRRVAMRARAIRRLVAATVVALPLLITASAQADTATFAPVADSYVTSDQPAANFGLATQLQVNGSSPIKRTYLRFNLALPSGAQVQSATLRVYTSVSSSTQGFYAFDVPDDSWGETTLTYGNAPAFGSQLAWSGAWSTAGYRDVVLPASAIANGANSLGLSNTSTYYKPFDSREGTNKPQLLVGYTVPTSPTPTPTPTPSPTGDTTPPGAPTALTAMGGDRSVALNWADNGEADLAGYRVYRRNADGTWPATPTATTTSSSYTDSGLTNGTAYTYRVTAYDKSSNESAPSSTTTATPTAPAAGDPVVGAAGDIACDPADSSYNSGNGTSSTCRQKYTSDLLVNRGLAGVLSLGDNQYESGALSAFKTSFDPTWGRAKSIMHPAVGNHEYNTSGAAGYFDYFNGSGVTGGRAGDRGKGYYSYDIGAWHLIALNSNCSKVSCAAGSAQETWLKNDLAQHPAKCTLAYWHHPRFSSGSHGSNTALQTIWQDLYNANADLVLSGHDHDYERFAPQNASGAADATRGIREFVVGTGGRSHYAFSATIANSEVRSSDTYGVLLLTLHASSYDWKFVPEAGRTFSDSGSTSCH